MKINVYTLIVCIIMCALTQSTLIHAQSNKAKAQSSKLVAKAPEITIKQQLPSVVTAGSEFDVTFTINKDNVQSFARLQQILPPGFTAKLKDGKDYHAFLSGNKAKHVWVSLPNSKEFKVTCHIKVSRKIEGTYVLGGQFDYVVNNQKQYAIVEPAKITVMPNATAELEEEEMQHEIAPVGGASAYDENIFDK